MASIYVRGTTIWARLKRSDGQWIGVSTGFRFPCDDAPALALWLEQAEALVATMPGKPSTPRKKAAPLTHAERCAAAAKERREAGYSQMSEGERVAWRRRKARTAERARDARKREAHAQMFARLAAR